MPHAAELVVSRFEVELVAGLAEFVLVGDLDLFLLKVRGGRQACGEGRRLPQAVHRGKIEGVATGASQRSNQDTIIAYFTEQENT